MRTKDFSLLLLSIGVTIILFFFNSCKKIVSSPQGESPKSDNQKLLALGFDTTTVIDMGDYYSVEGDIVISKSSLSSTIYRQAFRSNNELVGNSKQRNITVRIHSSVYQNGANFDWSAEVLQAINEYNKLATSNIRFTLTNSTTADITILAEAIPSRPDVIAEAPAPTRNSGNPGSFVRINTGYTRLPISSGQKKYNLIHELGHCIGVMHTNWYSTGEGPFPAVGNSPNSSSSTDPFSVMNGGTASFSWSGFSNWDIYAISVLYPSTTLAISSPDVTCGSVTISVDNLPSAATVNWSVASSHSEYSVHSLSCTTCISTTVTTNDYYASPYVTADIKINNQTVLRLNKFIKNVRGNIIPISGPYLVETNTIYTFYVDETQYANYDFGDAAWSIPPEWTVLEGGDGNSFIKIKTQNVNYPQTANIALYPIMNWNCGGVYVSAEGFVGFTY